MRAGADAWKERSAADAAGRTALLRALANSDIADNEKIALGTGLRLEIGPAPPPTGQNSGQICGLRARSILL